MGSERDTLHDYFLRNEGVVDFALRLVKTPEGLLDFYIHPAGQDGETADFHVSGAFTHRLDVAAGSSRPVIQIFGSGRQRP